MAMIELVDYNSIYSNSTKKKSGTRRSRRGSSKNTANVNPVVTKETISEEE